MQEISTKWLRETAAHNFQNGCNPLIGESRFSNSIPCNIVTTSKPTCQPLSYNKSSQDGSIEPRPISIERCACSPSFKYPGMGVKM